MLVKLTNKVMADPVAARIYASLADHVPPAILADNYLSAKLAGNKAECLAIELYLRQATARFFHVPGYIEALSALDRHIARRVPGNGGCRMVKDIAREIEARFASGDYVSEDGRAVFKIGNLTIRCQDMPGAVALVVAKYRRGLPKDGAGRYGSLNRP